MARPTTISRKQIVDAARAQFLSGGYGVSTSTIAAAAGVSEGSIFRRFPTKWKLFQAAMGMPEPRLDELIGELDPATDPRERLFRIGSYLLELLRTVMPRVMMMWAQPALDPLEALRKSKDAGPRVILETLTRFFGSELRRRRIRRHEPSVVARMFFSAMQSYVFFGMVGINEPGDEADATYVRRVIDVLWQGIAP